jgi:hypothetical protein
MSWRGGVSLRRQRLELLGGGERNLDRPSCLAGGWWLSILPLRGIAFLVGELRSAGGDLVATATASAIIRTRGS